MVPSAEPAGWSLLRPWWPAGSHCCWRSLADSAALPLQLPPAEAALVARAVARRQIEFAAGRWCARQGLQSLGLPVSAVLAGPDRSPLWPPGVVGAISHDDAWAVSLVGRAADWRGLGIDVDRVDRFRAELAPAFCTAFERQRYLAAPGADGPDAVLARIFSVKEAAFKALSPSVRQWIGFEDAELMRLPAGDAGACTLRLLRAAGPFAAGQQFDGAVAVADGRVVALLSLPGGVDGAPPGGVTNARPSPGTA